MSERRSISICENVLLVGLISLGPMNSFLAICEILWFQRQKCLENISSRGLVTLVSNEVEGSSIARVSWKSKSEKDKLIKVLEIATRL